MFSRSDANVPGIAPKRTQLSEYRLMEQRTKIDNRQLVVNCQSRKTCKQSARTEKVFDQTFSKLKQSKPK